MDAAILYIPNRTDDDVAALDRIDRYEDRSAYVEARRAGIAPADAETVVQLDYRSFRTYLEARRAGVDHATAHAEAAALTWHDHDWSVVARVDTRDRMPRYDIGEVGVIKRCSSCGAEKRDVVRNYYAGD